MRYLPAFQILTAGPVEIEFHRSARMVDVWPIEGGRKCGILVRESRFTETAETATDWAAHCNGRTIATDCTIEGALRAVAREHESRVRAARKRRAANRAAFNALWTAYRYGAR